MPHIPRLALGSASILLLLGSSSVLATELEQLPRSAVASGDSKEKVELGKKLFFDPRLSATGTVSCNSCHNLMEGGDDGRATSMGVDGLTGPRNAPTVWNSAFQASQFWDGRAATLEEQAKGPLVADVEMGMLGHDQVIARIKTIPGYVTEFAAAFGKDDGVTIENAVEAIAAFERTLVTPDSNLDKHLAGQENAMSEVAVRGLELFESIGCIECHSGPALNGWSEQDKATEFVDFPRFPESKYTARYDLSHDTGRHAVTAEPLDRHQFKTPTLRNITLTAPYLHNGKVATLSEACRVMASTQLDIELSNDEVAQLVEFMTALEGEFPELTLPRLPSSIGSSVLTEGQASVN